MSNKFIEFAGQGTLNHLERKESQCQNPWFHLLAHDVHRSVLDQKDKRPSQELSGINNVTDLFLQAKETADIIWQNAMDISLEKGLAPYTPKSEKGKDFIRNIKNNREKFFIDLSLNRNWQFDALRKEGDGEIWSALVLAISEREQLKNIIIQDWIENMSVDDFKRWGISKDELLIFTGLNLELQSDIDKVFVKQMTISDSPEDAKRNPKKYFSFKGASFLYIVGKGKNEKRYTFKDVFPVEIENIAGTLHKYAQIVQWKVASGELDKRYQLLPKYLSELGAGIKSDETNLGKISKNTDKYFETYAKLAEAGCPIVVNPHGFVPEEGDRADVELIVGLLLNEKSKWHSNIQALTKIAKEYSVKLKLSKNRALVTRIWAGNCTLG